MLPYKTMLKLDRSARTPIQLQICNEFFQKISSGEISSGVRLPGTRKMAELLSLNRKTVIAAYEELESQGWIEIKPNKGCFVSQEIPFIDSKSLTQDRYERIREQTSFKLEDKFSFLNQLPLTATKGISYQIDEGHPDLRLAPLKELAKNLSYLMKTPGTLPLMGYASSKSGDLHLREELAKYFFETRNIKVGIENILITRGSLMAFYLIFQTLLSPGDVVVVGEPGFREGHNTVKLAKGKLLKLPVDKDGLVIDDLEEICKKQKIRAVFIIPHHHYPTTVSFCASRRVQLLMLAQKYQFAIIEDDYDYDFHYSSSPILPMISSDCAGLVTYVGSFSKTIAPSLRMGFIIGPKNLIQQLGYLSRFIDSQGNTTLERSIAMLMDNGEFRRFLKKTTRIYHKRRDYFCELLNKEIGQFIHFRPPEGGLATWINIDPSIPVDEVVIKASKMGLSIPPRSLFCSTDHDLNALRLGFASLKEKEMEAAVKILKRALDH